MSRGYKLDQNGNFGIGNVGGWGIDPKGDIGVDPDGEASSGVLPVSLAQLTDVNTTGKLTDYVLKWNGTRWVPAPAPTGGGATALSALTDVSVAARAADNVLKWDAAQSRWVPGVITGQPTTLAQLTDVNTATRALDNVLKWDGSKWVPGVVTGGAVTYNAAMFKNWVDVTQAPYSANGDGVTDDVAAINSAIAATPVGGTLYFPPQNSNGYAIASGIVINKKIDVIMDAPVYYTGATDAVALTYGLAGSGNSFLFRTAKLQAVRQSSVNPPWSSEASIGIKVISAANSQINIFRAEAFTIGAQIIGDGEGNTMNTYQINQMYNNKIGLDMTQQNGGYCTENLFIGGRWGHQSVTNTTQTRIGVRMWRIDTTQIWMVGQNVFLKPSFEMNHSALTGGAEALPVLAEYAEDNNFISCRNEDNAPVFARVRNNSRSNIFDATSGVVVVDEQGVDPSSMTTTRMKQIYDRKRALVYHSGNLVEKIAHYDGASNFHIAGVHLALRSSNLAQKSGGAGYFTVTTDYLEIAGTAGSSQWGIGIFVDTRVLKRFIVAKDVEPGFGGSISIIPYDATGAVINDYTLLKSHPVDVAVFNQDNANLGFGCAGTLSATNYGDGDFMFTVGAAVKKARVVLHHSSTAMRIRSFSIYGTEQGTATAWVGYEQQIQGVNLATTTPTAGTYANGKTIYKDTPAAGDPIGWVKTAAGWKAFGLIP